MSVEISTLFSKTTSPATTGDPMSGTHPFDITDLPLFANYILIAAGSCIATLLISFIIQKIARCAKRRDEGLNLLEEISERSEPEGSSADCRVLGCSTRRVSEKRVDHIYVNVTMETEACVYSNINAPTQPPMQPDTEEHKDAEDYIDMGINPCLAPKKPSVSSLDVKVNQISTDMYVPPFKLHSAPDGPPPGQLATDAGAQNKDLPVEQEYILPSDDSLEVVGNSGEYANLESTSSNVGQNSSEGQGSKSDSGEIYATVKTVNKK